MDLLKFLIGSNTYTKACFLCFKSDKSNFDMKEVIEIRNEYDVLSVSLADMLKHLFPSTDFVSMQSCNDCSDLISELYIRIQNRRSKLLLLDYMVKQLIIKTNAACGKTVTNNKLIFNIQVPSYQMLNNKDHVSSRDNVNHLNEDKSCESTNLNPEMANNCHYCSETFLGTDELGAHLQINQKKRQRRLIYHYCKDCNYKTLSKTTLQAHINKNHLNARPHVCHVCYKGFYNRSNLNEHVKTHNNERNQVCELCGCSFIHKKSLIEHLRLHSDTRPYECDICHKRFVTSGRRSDHIKRSHMEKTQCCLICNKKYSLKKELTRHMNNVHLRSM